MTTISILLSRPFGLTSFSKGPLHFQFDAMQNGMEPTHANHSQRFDEPQFRHASLIPTGLDGKSLCPQVLDVVFAWETGQGLFGFVRILQYQAASWHRPQGPQLVIPFKVEFPVYPKNLQEDEFRDSLCHPTEVRTGSVDDSAKFGRLLTRLTHT